MRVIVIGAGIIGAAIAEELAVRGARVTVIDMRSPGRGASQASAGLLAPYSEAQEHPELLELCTRSLDLYDAFVARASERSALPVQYARDGTLEVALNDEEAERLTRMRAWLDDRGIRCEWLEQGPLRSEEPALSSGAAGGLLIRQQGVTGVASLVKALVQSARLAGAEFECPVEALRIEPLENEIEVRADVRTLAGDAVVLAGGAWSGRVRIAGHRAPAVRPVRGQLLHLVWGEGPLPRRPVWGSRVYTVPWSPDTLLVGATVEDVGFDERSTVAGVHDLLEGVGELLPGAWQSAMAEVRVGLRPASEAGMPFIGPIASGARIFVAAGHYRNGILLAPITAKMVADQIMEGTR